MQVYTVCIHKSLTKARIVDIVNRRVCELNPVHTQILLDYLETVKLLDSPAPIDHANCVTTFLNDHENELIFTDALAEDIPIELEAFYNPSNKPQYD